MKKRLDSPRIRSLTWGSIDVEGHKVFKDVKLFPGGAREWDWSETGTDHIPGVQTADVEELLEHGAEVVVLTKGMNRRLKVPPETVRQLEERGIAVHVLQTEDAVKVYNDLRKRKPTGGLFHSTC